MNLVRWIPIRWRVLVVVIAPLVVVLAGAVHLVPAGRLADLGFLAALAALVGLVGAGLALRSIVGPLRQLGEKLKESMERQADLVLRDRSPDEVGDLFRIANDYVLYRDHQALEHEQRATVNVSEQERIIADTRRERGHLGILVELSHSLYLGFDFQDSASRVLSRVNQVLGLEWSSVQVYDVRGTGMRLVASVGLDPDLTESLRSGGGESVQFHLGEGISGEAALRARPVVFNKGDSERRFKHFPRLSYSNRRIQTMCCVPISDDGKVVGVANFINIHDPPAFDEDVVSFLERVGELLGLLFSRSKSFEEAYRDATTGLHQPDYFRHLFRMACERVKRSRGKDELGYVRLAISFTEAGWDAAQRSRAHRKIGEIIRGSLRRLDVASREGDHYSIFLPSTDSLGTLFLAGRLKERIDRLGFEVDGGDRQMLVSYGGMAHAPGDVEDPLDLPDCLTMAVEEALRVGDHRLVCYRPELKDRLLENLRQVMTAQPPGESPP